MSRPRPPHARLRRRRIPLTAAFGLISFALSVALGVALSVQIWHTINRRSTTELVKTTRSVVALSTSMISLGLASGLNGNGAQVRQNAQRQLIESASKVLLQDSDSVAAEAIMSNGSVLGGIGADPVGSRITPDAGFRLAMQGTTQISTIHQSQVASLAPVVQRLARAHGDLLYLQEGVRLVPTGPVVGVVRVYASMRPSQRQATEDIRGAVALLAVGLLLSWAGLFRLVVGASRALNRQSKVNAYLATHDALTDLPNRALLRDRAEQAILASRRAGTHVGLILIDLDRFKELNDTLGHQYGDMLLRQIGPRLRDQLRESDTIARLGGDEFVILLPDLRTPQAAIDVAEKLSAALLAPFIIDGVVVDVGSSMGLASTPQDGDGFDQLLQHADVAMYVSKRDGLGVVVYDSVLDQHSPARLALLGELRRAVDDDEQIVLHYQPKADLSSGEIAGVEALVRWQHPTHGLLQPDDFIPLAERTGIIRPLTWCILRKALEQNKLWADDGLHLRTAVNISARCLLDVGFTDEVMRLLAHIGVPPERLEFELTESAIMTDPDRALQILESLDREGIHLAIDDFGTGYSSMAYLKQLPVHEIKIDRAFVTGMAHDPSDAAIVRSSLELAHNLHLTVVAEGVETEEVWQQLTDLGCGSVQGYLLSRPVPADQLTAWLDDRQRRGLGSRPALHAGLSS